MGMGISVRNNLARGLFECQARLSRPLYESNMFIAGLFNTPE